MRTKYYEYYIILNHIKTNGRSPRCIIGVGGFKPEWVGVEVTAAAAVVVQQHLAPREGYRGDG